MKNLHEKIFLVLTIILLLLGLASCSGAELPAKFIKAIHQVEASGRLGAIIGDNGRALGPFQIHKSYFIDSCVKGNYTNCADYQFSVCVVTGYLNRWCLPAIRKNNYETMARIHNGGPMGAFKSHTITYWKRVKKELDKQ